MLRLPSEDARPGPLMLEREEDAREDAADETGAESPGRNLPMVVTITGALALVALGCFMWWLMPERDVQQDAAPVVDTPPPLIEAPVAPAESPKTDRAEMDSVTRNFLEAKSIDELKPLIRHADTTLPKIASWLGSKSFEMPGLKDVGADIRFFTWDGLEVAIVPVRTADYGKREVTLVKEDAAWRVDWESWSGWSEMSWEEFRRTKPTTPKLFRVKVFKVDYYNFGFKDELEWRSYRLESSDGEESLFGYAKRGSDTDVRIDPRDVTDGKRMLVMLKFPTESPADNQVVIESIVAEGWLATDAAPHP